jgi:5-oxoprolinase (ATP-hydrolysing) subunit A
MNNIYTIDINCDLGEGSTLADGDKDALLMPYLSSCNIACGGHAGNLQTIEYAIKNALHHQLKIGAHPGYPDQANLGRRSLDLSAKEVVAFLHEQLALFVGVLNTLNTSLNHIKLHGALYNDVERNHELADVVADYLVESFPDIKLYGLAQGYFQSVCEDKKLHFVPEGFIDRRYQTNGTLVPRTETDAVITQINQCVQQAIAFAKNQPIVSSTGALISPSVKTICLHGDNENALAIVSELHQQFANYDISVRCE